MFNWVHARAKDKGSQPIDVASPCDCWDVDGPAGHGEPLAPTHDFGTAMSLIASLGGGAVVSVQVLELAARRGQRWA